MDKICFTIVESEANEKALVCAHERDYDGKGSYIARKLADFDALSIEAQIEMLNDMIIALINHVDVKDNIKFADYQRQVN